MLEIYVLTHNTRPTTILINMLIAKTEKENSKKKKVGTAQSATNGNFMPIFFYGEQEKHETKTKALWIKVMA